MRFVYLLGFIWCSPVTILSLMFYQGPLYLMGMVEKVEWRWKTDWVILWDIDNESKFFQVMRGWFGNVVGANITVTDVPDSDDEQWMVKALLHELWHVFQNYILGIFFFVAYVGHSGFIWAFQKEKHMHLDNFLERWARWKAGQPVEIPRSQWPDGPNDQCPWW